MVSHALPGKHESRASSSQFLAGLPCNTVGKRVRRSERLQSCCFLIGLACEHCLKLLVELVRVLGLPAVQTWRRLPTLTTGRGLAVMLRTGARTCGRLTCALPVPSLVWSTSRCWLTPACVGVLAEGCVPDPHLPAWFTFRQVVQQIAGPCAAHTQH